MRVLLIDVNCKQSSTGKIVYGLYSRLNAKGDEASVCYGRGPKVREKNIYKFGLDWETYLHAFMTRLTGFTGCFSFFSTRRLIKYIEKFKPDVIHIHELHAYFVNIIKLLNYIKEKGIRTIFTLHCEFLYTGKCGHSVECNQWKTECKKCPHKKSYISTWFFDRTHYMFKRKKEALTMFPVISIVAPSSWLADRIKNSFLGCYPITVIHNDVDQSVFYYRHDNRLLYDELEIDKKNKIILALAPNLMTKEKGGEYIVSLAKMFENDDVFFLMVGIDGPLNNGSNYKQFHRIYDKDYLARLYSFADVFVICSERENFPTTCLEAVSCGTPVCGFDTGGTKETDYINGGKYFAKYGDLTGLKAQILDLLERSDDRQKIHFESEFFQKYNSLYRLGWRKNG